MVAKRLIHATLFGALLAIPVMSVAQPYTMFVTFTQPLVDGPDADTHVDNPIVPIAPPTTPGTYGLATFVARGGPGVGPIEDPGYLAAASVRLYFNADQMEAPTAPAGVAANLLSRGGGLAPRAMLFTSVLGSPIADEGNGDGNPATTHRVLVTAAMATADPSTTLYTNNDPSAARFQLPASWTIQNPNHAPGSFEPLITTNVVVKPTATFPLQIGTTIQPVGATVTSRRLSDNAISTVQLFTYVNTAGPVGPTPTPLPTATPRVSDAGLSVQVESMDGAPSFVAYFVNFGGNNFTYQGDSGWIYSEDYDITFSNWPYANLPLRLQAFGGQPGGGLAGIYPIGSTTLNGRVTKGSQ